MMRMGSIRPLRTAIAVVFGVFAVAMSGCSLANPAPSRAKAEIAVAPRLKPGFVLDIRILVAGETEIEELGKRIRSEGDIILPLVGSVAVEGLTLETLANKVYGLYNDTYLVEPQVEIDFAKDTGKDAVSPWGYVTVLGCVRNSGRVNIPPTQRLRVSQAIQQAGGFDKGAKQSSIRVTRSVANGKKKRIIVDLHDVGAEGELSEDIVLRNGDVVFVAESIF